MTAVASVGPACGPALGLPRGSRLTDRSAAAPPRLNEPSPSPAPQPAPPVTTVSGADDLWHAHAVTLTFSAQDRSGTGIAATECSLDGGPWTATSSFTVRAPANHANDAVHTLSYYSRDNAGDVEETRSCTVRIDTTPPHVTARGPRPVLYLGSGAVSLTVTTQDISPVSAALRVYDAHGRCVYAGKAVSLPAGVRRVAWSGRTTSGRPLAPGTYDLGLVARDAAGNSDASATVRLRDQRPVSSLVVREVSPRGRHVALTFDDGGDAVAWASILTTLRRAGLHATFFPTGQMVAAHADLARRTVAEGHDIGDHSWNHPTMSTESYAADVSELRNTEAAWWRVAHVTPAPFFRPPYGDYSRVVTAAAGAAGYRYTVLWSVDPRDWSSPGVDAIVSRVLSASRAGSIILMHTCRETAAALPRIIAGLRARGLHPLPLHELLDVR